MIPAAIIMVIGGAIAYEVGRRMSTDQLKPNQIAGVRTPAAMHSDKAWYAAQRAAAGDAMIAGVVTVVGGVAMLLIGRTSSMAAAIILGTVGVLVLALAWRMYRKGTGAAKAVLGED